MAGEGTFPKSDGDVAYASEYNDFANMKLLTLISGTSGSFTPTDASADILIVAKTQWDVTATALTGNIYLNVDGGMVDQINETVRWSASVAHSKNMSLIYSSTYSVASHTVSVTINSGGGSLSNAKIMVFQLSPY